MAKLGGSTLGTNQLGGTRGEIYGETLGSAEKDTIVLGGGEKDTVVLANATID